MMNPYFNRQDSSVIDLYPHQQKDAAEIMAKLEGDPQLRLMYQSPTGSGKTEIALAIIVEMLKQAIPTVWVTHRRELVVGTMNRALKYGIICANAYENGAYGPYMSINSIIKAWRLEEPEGSLLVLDEAHHATAETWIRLIERHDGPVLGLSATPWRLTRKEGFDHIFDELLCGPQAQWLVDNDYLPKIVVWQSPTSRRGGEKNSKRTNVRGALSMYPTGDFNLSEKGTLKIHQAMVEQPILDWKANGGLSFKRSIFYAANVGVAIDQALILKNMGVGVGLLVADKKQMARAQKTGIVAERDKVIYGLETGAISVCINVMIVTEGVDIPTVECVVMGRPSMSKALVFQMIGRGMRLSEGKDYLLVVDSVENCTDPEIGLPTNIQEWSLEPRGDKTVGDAPAKQCLPKDKKGCGIVMPTGSHHCPSCGKPQGSICGRCHAFRFQWFVSRRRRQCSFCDAEDDQRREEAVETGLQTGQHGIWYKAKVFWYDADRKLGGGERDLERMKWARNTDLWLIWVKGRQETIGDSMYITVARKATKKRKGSISTEHARAIYCGPMGTAFITRDDAKAYDAYLTAQKRNSLDVPAPRPTAEASRFEWPPKLDATKRKARRKRKPAPPQGRFESMIDEAPERVPETETETETKATVAVSIDGVEVDLGSVSLEEIDDAIERNSRKRK